MNDQNKIPIGAGAAPAEITSMQPTEIAGPMRSAEEIAGKVPCFETPRKNTDGSYPGCFESQN
jgi:hypothetical protein